jgi:transcriptional regulator with XRE-family HTH domain
VLQKVLQSFYKKGTMETFGEWLRGQRAARKLTREEFAKRVGCSVAMLRKIENDERRPPEQIADLLANCLDVPLEERSNFIRATRGELRVDRLTELRNGEASLDIERETNRQLERWARIHDAPNGPGEYLAKVGLRAELLERLLGERLITRCIHVDRQGLTMAQVQQIVEFPLSDVPIDRLQTDGDEPNRELQVVDRDSFALELAREWVKTGLPRNPIR